MAKSVHQILKLIEREKKHRQWLEQNLDKTSQLRECKKNLLKLYTELAMGKQQEMRLQTSQDKT